MEKKYINELTREELEKVYENNQELRYEIQQDMEETELFYVGEQLDFIRNSLADWSVGSYSQYNKIEIKDYAQFIESIVEMQKAFCTLADKDEHKIEECLKLKEKLWNLDTVEQEEEFEEIEEDFENACDELADDILKVLVGNLESTYEEEYQLDYFLEFYAEERLGEAYILIEENEKTDYVLFKDVVKSYN